MTYRVKDWHRLFENNRTRELKRMDWVPVPNRMDGLGYTELVDHPNGAAHFGAWLAIIEIASRREDRGTLPQEGAGIPQALARISRLPAGLFAEVLPRLVNIGWLEQIQEDREIPQDGAGLSHLAAGLSQDDAGSRARGYGTGQESTEGNGRSSHLETSIAETTTPEPILVRSALPAKTYSGGWYDTQHLLWYSGFWNHENRKASRVAFEKRVRLLVATKAQTSPEAAVEFLIYAAADDRRRFEPTEAWSWRSKLHPATWLNGSRWEDEAQAPLRRLAEKTQIIAANLRSMHGQ